MGLKITFTQHVFSYKEDAFQMSRKSSLRTYFELCFEKCRMFDQGWTKQVFRLMNVKIALTERKSWSLWENLWRKEPPTWITGTQQMHVEEPCMCYLRRNVRRCLPWTIPITLSRSQMVDSICERQGLDHLWIRVPSFLMENSCNRFSKPPVSHVRCQYF